jgi:hypothetical protein
MPATKRNKADNVFRQIVEWVQKLFGQKKQKYQPQRILKEHTSSLTRLLLLERDTSRAVRTWRSVPKNTDYDVLLTCDHLYRVPGEPAIEKQNPHATHRLVVIQMSRIPGPKGTKRVTPVWSGDFNFVGSSTGSADIHRYAIVITDAIAKQLLGVPDEEIDWLWEVGTYAKQYVGTTVALPTPPQEAPAVVTVKSVPSTPQPPKPRPGSSTPLAGSSPIKTTNKSKKGVKSTP